MPRNRCLPIRLTRELAKPNAVCDLFGSFPANKRTQGLKAEKESRPVAYHNNWRSSGLALPAHPNALRDWLQAIRLQTNEDYLLDPKVRSLRMGLAWDKNHDIDASAIMLDQNFNGVDAVWFRQLQSQCRSVSHSGDNLNGNGNGDDEVITVKLDAVPQHVHHIVFTVSVYSFDVSFADVRNASVRMIHGNPKHKDHVLCYCSLTEMSGNSLILAQLTRKGGYWNFRTLGKSVHGRCVQQIMRIPQNLECLRECPSIAPQLRRISVQVIGGSNLAAKDAAGWLRSEATSDPYYVISFKNSTCASEYQKQNLNPVWKHHPFQLGSIMDSESKALKITVYDYDAMSSDDFMGVVWIPVSALYNAGIGTHELSFPLGPSKDPRHKNEDVSGDIHLRVQVEQVATNESFTRYRV